MTRWILIASFTVVASARAQSPEVVDDISERKAPRPEVFVGFSTGAGYSIVSHPHLKQAFVAPTLTLNAGVHLSEKWSLGLEVEGTARWVTRPKTTIAGQPIDVYVAGADCTTCMAPPAGGYTTAVTASFNAIGPRLDFSPWGKNGPYAGVGAGFAWISGLPTTAFLGGAGSGHLGFRYRFFKVAQVGAEAGLYGQRYADASVLTPYASASAHFAF